MECSVRSTDRSLLRQLSKPVLAFIGFTPTVRLIVRTGNRQDETVARRVDADEVILPEVVSGKQVCERL